MKTLRRGKVFLWITALVLVGAAGGFLLSEQARRFSTRFAQVEADRRSLVLASQGLHSQLESLQQERKQLAQASGTLASDRDNLLTQAQRLSGELQELSVSSSLHERVLKRTAEENRTLRSRLIPLERDYEELQRLHEGLLESKEQLERALEEARQRTKERQWKEQFEKERAKRDQDAEELRQVRARNKELEVRQAKTRDELSKLQKRLDALQENYATLLSKNKEIMFQAKHVPQDVTQLAREHERLLKDVADTHYNMGVLFAKSEDYTRAVKEFQNVVELKPDDADAHYNLGLIYAEHLPDREKATAYFRRYLEINPQAQDASWVKRYIVSWRAWEAKERLE
jgi:tetratricopeptide (TPR) repeat protein